MYDVPRSLSVRIAKEQCTRSWGLTMCNGLPWLVVGLSGLCISCAAPKLREGRADVELRMGHEASRIVVHWSVSNVGTAPIWVPLAWGDDSPSKGPFAFLTPSGVLVLVFGDFRSGEDRAELQWIEEADVGARLTRVDAGRSYRGIVVISLPYAAQEIIANPYRTRSGGIFGDGRRVALRRATGVRLAVQYWACDPSRHGAPPAQDRPWETALYIASEAKGLTAGVKPSGLNVALTERIAVSRTVPADIPLMKEAELDMPQEAAELFPDDP